MTDDEIIAVVQARRDGKVIEYNYYGKWVTMVSVRWDFSLYEYRVKPKPIEAWAALDGGGELQELYFTNSEAYNNSPYRAKIIRLIPDPDFVN